MSEYTKRVVEVDPRDLRCGDIFWNHESKAEAKCPITAKEVKAHGVIVWQDNQEESLILNRLHDYIGFYSNIPVYMLR